jgi:hypothetical protein
MRIVIDPVSAGESAPVEGVVVPKIASGKPDKAL